MKLRLVVFPKPRSSQPPPSPTPPNEQKRRTQSPLCFGGKKLFATQQSSIQTENNARELKHFKTLLCFSLAKNRKFIGKFRPGLSYVFTRSDAIHSVRKCTPILIIMKFVHHMSDGIGDAGVGSSSDTSSMKSLG